MATRAWTYDDIPQDYRTNGGVWEPADASAGTNNQIATAPDRWGVRPMVQGTSAAQIYRGDRSGFPAFVWPDTRGSRRMQPAAAFAPAWWIFVLAYNDGVRATFLEAPTIIGEGTPLRVIGDPGTSAHLFQNTATTWAQTLKKDAGAYASEVLPMPMCLAEVRGPSVPARWALGGTQSNSAWQGPMWFVMALGTEPTGDLLARIQGSLAWRFGLQAKLPSTHPYRGAPPVVELPSAKGGAQVAAMRADGRTAFRIAAHGMAQSSALAKGVGVMRLEAGGGASLLAAEASGFGRHWQPILRRSETAGTSANGQIGPDGIRTIAGDDGLRSTRAE